MPLHDWTRVPSGLFHHFHQDWSIEITRALNRGRLPKGLSALVERRAGVKEPDVLFQLSFMSRFNLRTRYSTSSGLSFVFTGHAVFNRVVFPRLRNTVQITFWIKE